MQLKLPENIKRYRKEMNLTQEGLAEAFGVTIGAVSKWENGNNVPDILTLMELANFFNISVDELLGYDISSKKVEDMVDRLAELCHEYRFEEAVAEANNALVRYPHNFTIVYNCAEVYFLKYIEGGDDQDRDTSIELFERSIDHLSQNTDNEISEYTIRHRIAELYAKKDPEKALETLKSINYDGCNNKTIASVLMKSGRFEEALEYGTQAILRASADQYSTISNMAMSLAASGKKKDIEKAIELANMNIALTDLFSAPGKVTYFHKLQAITLILKAWWLSCLKRKDEMEACVAEGYRLAALFDSSESSNEISAGIRFYYSKKKAYSYDSTGASAVSGVESMFVKDEDPATAKNYKYMADVIEAWEKVKKKNTKG